MNLFIKQKLGFHENKTHIIEKEKEGRSDQILHSHMLKQMVKVVTVWHIESIQIFTNTSKESHYRVGEV